MKDFWVTLTTPLNLTGLLQGWRLDVFNNMGKRIWKLVPAAECWEVWRERNTRVFKGHLDLEYQVYRWAKDLIIFWARRCKGYEGLPQGALVWDWSNTIGAS